MNGKTLAELALKIWGVLLVLGAILALPTTLWMAWTPPPSDAQAFIRMSQLSYLLNVVVQAVGGIVLLVWADRIVGLFESDVTPLHLPVSSAQLQVLAFAIVGVFVLIEGVQNAAAAGYVLMTKPNEVETWRYMREPQGEALVKAVVQIAAGTLLVFGREAVARGWSRVRGQAGPDPADAEESG